MCGVGQDHCNKALPRIPRLETIVPQTAVNNVGLIGYRRTRDHEPSSARGRRAGRDAVMYQC